MANPCHRLGQRNLPGKTEELKLSNRKGRIRRAQLLEAKYRKPRTGGRKYSNSCVVSNAKGRAYSKWKESVISTDAFPVAAHTALAPRHTLVLAVPCSPLGLLGRVSTCFLVHSPLESTQRESRLMDEHGNRQTELRHC